MKKYMDSYIKGIDNYITQNHHNDIDDVLREHTRKIRFFQHERTIHLLVTLFFALFCIIFSFKIYLGLIFIIIAIIFYILLLGYILHYYYLENAVQYMYKQHDDLIKIANQYD